MKIKITLILSLTMIFSACKPDEPNPGNGNNYTPLKNITLKFNAVFENQALSWSSQYYTAAGDSIQFDKIKFILSNFTLEKAGGSFITVPDAYAYLTFKEGRDSVVLTGIPEGDYKSIRFQVGLDSAINHSDPTVWANDHPLNPSLTDMHWDWSGGYIFNIIEGYYQNQGLKSAFSFHVALLKNARVHSFADDFDIKADKRFVFELKADRYFSNIVNYSLKNDGATSHSMGNDPVMAKFIQNMSGLFELKSIK